MERKVNTPSSVFILGSQSCDEVNGGKCLNFYSSLFPESWNAITELPNRWNLLKLTETLSCRCHPFLFMAHEEVHHPGKDTGGKVRQKQALGETPGP